MRLALLLPPLLQGWPADLDGPRWLLTCKAFCNCFCDLFSLIIMLQGHYCGYPIFIFCFLLFCVLFSRKSYRGERYNGLACTIGPSPWKWTRAEQSFRRRVWALPALPGLPGDCATRAPSRLGARGAPAWTGCGCRVRSAWRERAGAQPETWVVISLSGPYFPIRSLGFIAAGNAALSRMMKNRLSCPLLAAAW